MTDSLKDTLKELAEKYEVASFCDADPSQFLRWYNPLVEENRADVEACSFIAAMLAFGNRKQFIPKIASIMELADKTSGSISKWLVSGAYKESFSKSENKFYRFYSYNDMHDFFGDLAELLREGDRGGLGASFQLRFNQAVEEFNAIYDETSKNGGKLSKLQRPILADVVSAAFPHASIVPKGKNTANKRIHMFLRWMVRSGSPVDLGFWSWYSPAELLIPLDVHVMEEGIRLGALPENARATRKTAIQLTQSLKEIWPTDPCKGDFALFGLGVDSDNSKK